MPITAGSIIISTPLLHGSNFEQSIVLITEKNEQGATGFVVNKLFNKVFNELVAYSSSQPFSLYNGGPVATESLFFIHCCPHLISGGNAITNNLFVGGNFEQAAQHINQKNISESDIKLLIGYCGWDAGELEAEIEEGSWLVSNESTHAIFFPQSSLSWSAIYQKLTLFQ